MTVKEYEELTNFEEKMKIKIIENILDEMEAITGKRKIDFSKTAYLMLKPEFTSANIIKSTEKRVAECGLKVLGASAIRYKKGTAVLHYIDLTNKPFVDELTDYLSSGNCYGMMLYGDDAIQKVRNLACGVGGKTSDVKPDGLRYEFGIRNADGKLDLTKNVVHATGDERDAKGEFICFVNLVAKSMTKQKLAEMETNKSLKKDGIVL